MNKYPLLGDSLLVEVADRALGRKSRGLMQILEAM